MKFRILVLLASFVLAHCASKSNLVDTSNEADFQNVVLMTFNVENLFDTNHDAGKDDFAYLPLAKKKNAAHRKECAKIKVPRWKEDCLKRDWSEAEVKAKMARLASTILKTNKGEGPDVLFLQEVENKGVLERLNKEHLGGRYPTIVLIEGPDERGIDTALMSKLKVRGEPVLHAIPLQHPDPAKASDTTRGILEVPLELPDGETLVTYTLHLPSPGNPPELRTQSLEILKRLSKESRDKGAVVAAGDFNITSEENKSEKRTETLAKDWIVSHDAGCKSCVGTYYYAPKNDWSFLDWMLFSKNLAPAASGWFVDSGSIRVVKDNPLHVDADGRPIGFDGKDTAQGVSDHFPLEATLRKRR